MSKDVESVKLLIVDDEEEFLESSARALGRRGFEVNTAVDGATALEIMKQRDFDVVVLDLKMPGMDGEEVFDRIHKDRPSTPVIMLTGHGSVPHAFKTSKKGIADYIAKPCDMDELADRIRKAVSMARRHKKTFRDETATDLASMVRVMLVDDEVDFLSSMRSALERRNMNVTIAESGAQALERLKDAPIDIAVIDVKMPGMDGLELLKRIKKELPDVKAILLSGHPSVSAALEGIKHGASEYLEKPPEVESLVATIRRLSRQRQEDIAEQQKKLIEEIRSRYPD